MRPGFPQRFKPFSVEDALEGLVGHLGVGDGSLAQQHAVGGDPRGILPQLRRPDIVLQDLVDHAVDAAEEEAGDRCHPRHIFAGGQAPLQTRG